jgi:hypothetical protein
VPSGAFRCLQATPRGSDADAPDDVWVAYYGRYPSIQPKGVLFGPDGKPDLEHLRGRNILHALLPARPEPRELRNRERPDGAYAILAPFFTTAADEHGHSAYEALIVDQTSVVADVWAPRPLSSSSNLNITDFAAHAATCGLTVAMANGPVRAFCERWLSDDAARAEKLAQKASGSEPFKMDLE